MRSLGPRYAPSPFSARRARKTPRRAFSMIELLTVVGIVGILAAVVVPSLAGSSTQKLESAARILAGDLQYARQLAIQYDTLWGLDFDLTRNRYELKFRGAGTPPVMPRNSRAAGDAPGAAYVVDLGKLGESTVGNSGVRLAGVALQNSQQPAASITFHELGSTAPSRSQDTVIWLTHGAGPQTKYVRLTVSWVTGQVWVDRPAMFTTHNALFD